MGRINGLDLFSGIGGIAVALKPWVRTIGYCEINTYSQAVLFSRMEDDSLEWAPVWPDICTLTEKLCPPDIDILTGGFPCQDISIAGTGAGLEGERSGLFFEIIRLTRELRPRFVFLENVPAITTRGGLRVITEFTELGYDCRWTIVSAAELGAPHLRKRWFLLAHSRGERLEGQRQRTVCTSKEKPQFTNCSKDAMANALCGRLAHGSGKPCQDEPKESAGERARSSIQSSTWWEVEPDVGRVADGFPGRVDRIKALGNAVVPAQAREAFKRLMGLASQTGTDHVGSFSKPQACQDRSPPSRDDV